MCLRLQTVYLSLCGGNQFFFLMRLFKLLDFQPRIGILTRTIGRALEDLAHFMLLLIIVLMAYSAMGHIIFGPYVSVRQALLSWPYEFWRRCTRRVPLGAVSHQTGCAHIPS